MSPKNKKSKVFAFGTGQLALHVSTGSKVKVIGARRTRRMGLLIVAKVTSNARRGRVIVAKASSFAARQGVPATAALTLGV